MDDLTSLCYFFAKSPKRQQYFETIIDYHKDELSISDSNKKHVISWQKRVGLRDTKHTKITISFTDSLSQHGARRKAQRKMVLG